MNRNDSLKMKPRSFWPLGIFVAFLLFIAGIIVLIALSVSSNSDLVAIDYYEQEIRYQGQLDRLNRAQQLPNASATYDDRKQAIEISLPPEHASAGARGDIQLYRPSAASLDQNHKLQLDDAGRQKLDAASLQPGLWRIKINWSVAGEEFAIEEIIVVGKKI